jgi:outer membrane protein assembly factor BamB
MFDMLRRKFILFVSVFTLCGLLSCAPRQVDSRKPVHRKPVSRWLVSPQLLEQAKLEIVWDKKLPIQDSERLERLLILGDRIYALSDQNYMVSLDRKNGNYIFSRAFAQAGLAVVGLEVYEGELISVIGSRLVQIDPDLGTELRSKRLEFGVSCPAARNNSYFYLAASDRRLHRFRAEDKVELPPIAAQNDSLIISVIADDNWVVFATDAGNLIKTGPDSDRPRLLWQFDAGDGIVGPIVRDGESVFLASKDTYVYRINMKRGSPPVWKFQTEAILDRGPRVTEKVVYQYVLDKGLTAIDKASGKLMWRVEGGLDLLAEGGGKAYVFRERGELVVVDKKKNKELYSVNFAQVSRYAADVAESKIYIADEAGRIACLQPVE